MFCAAHRNSLFTDNTEWHEAMNTGKKQENATIAIFEALPIPNRSRNTGRNAIFGTAKRNDTSGSKKLRTPRTSPAPSPTHTPTIVPIANPASTRYRLTAAACGSSPSAVTSHNAARICDGYDRYGGSAETRPSSSHEATTAVGMSQFSTREDRILIGPPWSAPLTLRRVINPRRVPASQKTLLTYENLLSDRPPLFECRL